MDKVIYTQLTDIHLEALLQQIDGLPAEVVTQRLNTILDESAREACPPPPRKKRKSKYKWHASFKPAAQKESDSYHELKKIKKLDRPNSPQMLAYRAARKILRKAQRQAEARRRIDIQESIMKSYRTKDKREYHKIIRERRKPATASVTMDFAEHTIEGSEADSWAKYYQHLATPADDETFDKDNHQHVKLTHLLVTLNSSGQTLPEITPKEVKKHLASLHNGKAADIYGISAKHMKWASPKIVLVLCKLTNLAVKTAKLPAEFKIGSITPVHKKNKPLKLPTYYRRITITALIGKLVSCHILANTDATMDVVQSRLQFGFTMDLAPIFAAVIVTEAIAQALDNNEQLLITFMDTSKAFDVCHHGCLLNALQLQGVEGSLWRLYDSMYSGSKSVVKWKGNVSKPLEELQGIKQGEKTAASCYKAGKNRLLKRLDSSPTLHIGSIGTSAVMVADDLAIDSTQTRRRPLP